MEKMKSLFSLHIAICKYFVDQAFGQAIETSPQAHLGTFCKL